MLVCRDEAVEMVLSGHGTLPLELVCRAEVESHSCSL